MKPALGFGLKSVAVFVAIAFLTEQIVWANPDAYSHHASISPSTRVQKDERLIAIHAFGKIIESILAAPDSETSSDDQLCERIRSRLEQVETPANTAKYWHSADIVVKDRVVYARLLTKSGGKYFQFYSAVGYAAFPLLSNSPFEVAAEDAQGHPAILAQIIGKSRHQNVVLAKKMEARLLKATSKAKPARIAPSALSLRMTRLVQNISGRLAAKLVRRRSPYYPFVKRSIAVALNISMALCGISLVLTL